MRERRDFEGLSKELRDIDMQINAMMLLVEPTHTDPDGEGTPSQDMINALADSIGAHLRRIADDLEEIGERERITVRWNPDGKKWEKVDLNPFDL